MISLASLTKNIFILSLYGYHRPHRLSVTRKHAHDRAVDPRVSVAVAQKHHEWLLQLWVPQIQQHMVACGSFLQRRTPLGLKLRNCLEFKFTNYKRKTSTLVTVRTTAVKKFVVVQSSRLVAVRTFKNTRRSSTDASMSTGTNPVKSCPIPTKVLTLKDWSQLPDCYSQTPGGTLFSTTPGGNTFYPI